MTKEEILATAGFPNTQDGIVAFYKAYDKPEKFFAKHGGNLSGAPHNGQPTAKEFFSYGSHANDGINIPMGNPLYLAYGGIPMDQQEGGFIDYNNNTTYPTFSQGGYDYEDGGMMNNSSDNYIYNYGGSYDPGLQKYQGDKQGSQVTLTPQQVAAADQAFGRTDHYEIRGQDDENANTAYKAQIDSLYRNPKYDIVSKIDSLNKVYPTVSQDFEDVPWNTVFKPDKEYNKNKIYKQKNFSGRSIPQLEKNEPENLNTFENKPNPYFKDIFFKAYCGNQTDPGKLSDLLRQKKANDAALAGIRSSFGPKDDTTNVKDNLVVSLNKAKDFQIQLANKIKNHPDNIKKEEDGGSVINLINALTKAKKKAYGGAKSQPGGNQSHIENLRSTFDGVINNNVHNALINEQADAVKEMYRTGGLMQAQDGVAGTAVDPQVKQNAFKQNVDKYDNALNGSFSDLVYSNKRNNYYPNYYQGMNYMPMNYSPLNKISKEDDSKYQELLKNPSSQLTGYKNKSYLNGLFGKTEFTFGYKDHNSPVKLNNNSTYHVALDPDNGIPKRTYGPEEGYNFQKDAAIKNPYLLNAARPTSVINPNSTDANQQVFPSYRKIDYMHKYLDVSKQNIQTPSSGPNSSMLNAMDNSVKGTNETQILSPQRYGGLYKAQYGVDHKSTNPMDGTYDNYGNIISSGSNGMTGGWGTSFTTPQSTALAGKPTGNITSGMTMSGTSGTEANDKLAPILKDATTNTASETGEEKQVKITSKQRPNFNHEAVANWTNTGMDIVSNIFNKAQDRSKEQLANMQLGDNSFNVNNQEKRGDYDMNSGDFRPNEVLNTKYGGYMQQGGYPQQSAQQPNQEQIVQGVAQMLQQGAQPEEIAQQLIQMGLPQEEAMQLIQAVMQQLQGGQEQQPMQYGGYSMDEEDEESYEDDLTEDEIAELRNGGYNVQYI